MKRFLGREVMLCDLDGKPLSRRQENQALDEAFTRYVDDCLQNKLYRYALACAILTRDPDNIAENKSIDHQVSVAAATFDVKAFQAIIQRLVEVTDNAKKPLATDASKARWCACLCSELVHNQDGSCNRADPNWIGLQRGAKSCGCKGFRVSLNG